MKRTRERDNLAILDLTGLAQPGNRHIAALAQVDGLRQVQDGEFEGRAEED